MNLINEHKLVRNFKESNFYQILMPVMVFVAVINYIIIVDSDSDSD
jgi:hypothetical protein